MASVDPDIILNLESQVSELSRHLSQPGRTLPEFEDVLPRISDIERTLAGNRQSILEAARLAEESAVRSFSGSKPESAAVSALADDLRLLDELARCSDERNPKTFDAIHDTLFKIGDRLGSLEEPRQTVFAEPIEPPRKMVWHSVPSIATGDDMRITADAPMRAQAAELWDVEPVKCSPAPSLSMFSRLSRVFSKKERSEPSMTDPPPLLGRQTPTPTLDVDQPSKRRLTNRPLEPGSGTTDDLNAVTRRVRDERSHLVKKSDTDDTKSDFLAPARRAA